MLTINEYMDLTEQLVEEITSLSVCHQYKKLQAELSADTELCYLITQFDKAKDKYETIKRYGFKYHPDYPDVSKQLMEAKTALFNHQTIQQIKACEKEIQAILDQIASAMQDVIKVEPKPKSAKGGCQGGCSR